MRTYTLSLDFDALGPDKAARRWSVFEYEIQAFLKTHFRDGNPAFTDVSVGA